MNMILVSVGLQQQRASPLNIALFTLLKALVANAKLTQNDRLKTIFI